MAHAHWDYDSTSDSQSSLDSSRSSDSDMDSDSETATSDSDWSINSDSAIDSDSRGSSDSMMKWVSSEGSDSDTCMITLYHYTSKEGAKGIRNSGVIEASTSTNDARFGEGVYFTSIDPNHDPEDILLNNYDDGGNVINSSMLWKKIKWVVEVEMPEDDVEEIEGPTNRDIYLYPRKKVVLRKYDYDIYKNPCCLSGPSSYH